MPTPAHYGLERGIRFVFVLLFLTLVTHLVSRSTFAQNDPLTPSAETQSPAAETQSPAAETQSPAVETQWPLTVAESSDYQATSSSAEVEDFLLRITQAAPHLQLEKIGQTDEGRPIWCVQTKGESKDDPQKDPSESSMRLRIVLIGNIHSGECAGKEAILETLRMLAQTPDHPWLQQTELYVVPNYSADANERLGIDHRPGQVGPSHGMGLRETPAGLDLNRDFMKLEAPETRALVQLFNRIDPHVFIDCHTTNGSRHRYKLTYDIPHHPGTSPALRALLRQEILPTVTQRLHEEQQIDTFYYGNFNRDRTRWSTYGYEPRYSTEYAGIRGILGVLSEAYSYATYEERIAATREFVKEVIDRCIELKPQVLAVTQEAKQNVSRDKAFTLTAELAPFENSTTILGYGEKDEPINIELEFWGKYEPRSAVQQPAEYWLSADQSWIAERLAWHGIPVYALKAPTPRDVESFVVQQVERDERPFQGHLRPTIKVARRAERQVFPIDTFVVKSNEGGRLLAALLEPEASDSLVSWNFLDEHLVPGGKLPYYRIAEETPLELLKALDRIEPTEELTLDKIFGPEGRANYSGTSLSVTWEAEGDWYRQTLDGRTTRTEASSGNRQRVEPTVANQAIAEALATLKDLTEEEAQQLAKSVAALEATPKGHLLKHEGNLIYITPRATSARWLTRTERPQELEEIDPTETRVAYVRGNNLYVQSLVAGEEVALTEDGSATLFNGKLDWVYQEELYGRGNFKGFWWSPSGRFLAFLKLDEQEVHRFTVTDHIPTRQELEVTSYPKAGDPNPTVAIGIVDVETGKKQWLDLAPSETPEPLISRVGWHPTKDQLVFQVQDRVQTFLDFYVATAGNDVWEVQRWFRETSPAWIESPGQPQWLNDGSFLWLSSRGGTQQIYLYNANGELVRAVTSGPGEVRDLLKINESLQEIWVSATFDSRIERHTYRVALSGDEPIRVTEPGWDHSTQVSPSGNFLIDTCSTAGRPTQVRLLDREGEVRRLLNPNVPDRLRHVKIVAPEFMQVEARDGHRLDAMLIVPPDFDPSSKYPVVVHVYSGPQAPTVRNSWRGTTYLWHQFLAQQGYVIWMCDNRSATYGGAEDAWPIHRDLGTQELADIEDGLKWLTQHDWIDSERIGIWGWSYGGYMTAFALTHSKMFKAGIAGAPVTDWANYDTIYTERYMGRPQENQEGYQRSSVLKAAADLHGRLLLIHGSMDDNVHLTNTLQLAYELQREGKEFELMIYPKSRHGVTQPNLRRHLRGLMTEFLKANL
jgi:dipeptidyl-peptidase-4